ncbi:MAG: hypothetical protein A2951_01265 [Candidatus Buchananbacteria bacterium RIFCSPLOWO2_01_FULL_56_15]|uniref:Uncharacterized protein n=2 Tax=Candidatus Buchananiibacteriota TaxID=1817903 RepID=A0A1G1YHX0_9BACT|nr:MAG: hypothetical protein A3J59_04840 [Candidatus Buchananbacteria bacterium RIFCSPHIGHO2_02_FULL_56_16]OGY54644.1 MAG: hypothetical protein A2951_01265 [Candidatus Buchananbacteria bacterium RIFCSPLOWO2_01_FULL_56_15]
MLTRERLRSTLVSLFLLAVLLPGAASAAKPVGDQVSGGFNTMVKWTIGGGNAVTIGPATFSSSLIHIINFLLSFIGLLFFLLMLYAGYLWMTARGNDEQVQKGKKIIREAVTALIIILLARLFTEFVLTAIGQAIEAGKKTS